MQSRHVAPRAISWARGAVAARLLCKQEAVGSNPTESIVIKNKKKEIFAFAFRLKTDVSKESFGVSPSGRRRSKLDADLGFSAGENPFS